MKRILWWVRLNLMILGASYLLAALTTRRLDYAYELNQHTAAFFVLVSVICAVPLGVMHLWGPKRTQG